MKSPTKFNLYICTNRTIVNKLDVKYYRNDFNELVRRYRLRARCLEVFILRNCEIHYRDVMVLTLSLLRDDKQCWF